MKAKDVPYWISYIGENDDFRWQTTMDATFDITSVTRENFILKNGDGAVIAESESGSLLVHKGYKWDGCTGIGKLTETGPTLIASIPHDILYIAKKDAGGKLKYSLAKTDTYFRSLMAMLYGKRGMSSIRPNLYYGAVVTFGLPFKFNRVPGYTVEVPSNGKESPE